MTRVNQNTAATDGKPFPEKGRKLPDAPNGDGTAGDHSSRVEAAAEALYWWEVRYREWPRHSWATLAEEAPHSQARFRSMADAALAAAALAGEAGTAETQSGSAHEHAADLSATPMSPQPPCSTEGEGNLIALAKMYGEACGVLMKLADSHLALSADVNAAESEASHLREQLRESALQHIARDLQDEQAATEIAHLRERVEKTLDEACRMSAILLMAGEMTAQERRTARAVANGLAAKVRAALSSSQTETRDA